MATASDEVGTMGKWAAFKISGAMLVAAIELGVPGVPWAVALEAQFWPESLAWRD